MSYKITWNIPDKNVAVKFMELADKKLGNEKGRYGKELQKAMTFYMNNIGKVKTKTKTEKPETAVWKDYDKLIKAFEKAMPNGNKLDDDVLDGLIIKILGKCHDNTLNSRKKLLLVNGIISKSINGETRIFPDRIKDIDNIDYDKGKLEIPKTIEFNLIYDNLSHFIHPQKIAEKGNKFDLNGMKCKIINVETMSLGKLVSRYTKQLGYTNPEEVFEEIDKCYGKPEEGKKTHYYIYEFKRI